MLLFLVSGTLGLDLVGLLIRVAVHIIHLFVFL